MDKIWIVWLALMVGCLILESVSLQLFSVWFAIGAFAALISYLFRAPEVAQIAIFIVVSGVALAATRPLVKKLLLKKVEPTNADRSIGKEGVVLEEINNTGGAGQVKLEGVVWTARSVSGEVIPAGALVKAEAIQGVKLMVSRVEQTAESGENPSPQAISKE
ncbi:MAG: NfeD family protein [Oscillospiraceae bacterium]|nr:NfeD family protein [Oscillospiraceae bacterium]